MNGNYCQRFTPSSSLLLLLFPLLTQIAADFNGDGLTDIMALTAQGLYGWAQTHRFHEEAGWPDGSLH
eukprot:scaffold243561_cov22-Tisochrysis_lutea.AAC.1